MFCLYLPFLLKNISFPSKRKRNLVPNRLFRIYKKTRINLFLIILYIILYILRIIKNRVLTLTPESLKQYNQHEKNRIHKMKNAKSQNLSTVHIQAQIDS